MAVRIMSDKELARLEVLRDLDCKIARDIDPTLKVQQRHDSVTKDGDFPRRLSRPTVTPPQLQIGARYQ